MFFKVQQILVLAVLLTFAGCQPAQESASNISDADTELLHARNLQFNSYFNLKDAKGQTYLNFMTTAVKPAMDKLATDGYTVKDSASIELAYNASNSKVKSKVNSWGLALVKSIADQLAGQNTTLNTLPEKILSLNTDVDAFNLATFVGLASGGGVKIEYFDSNYGLNVHYDLTEERSGRSFGVGPTRGANDASDKQYLDDLQDYLTGNSQNSAEFYRTLLQSLLNSDSANYANVTKEGQTVLTDFLAVYTAEQARNLMDGNVSPHWDAALLEVTMLGVFHSGQDEMKLYYRDSATGETTFTNSTLRQTPCQVSTAKTVAKMRDYWQFSRNISSASSCRRSGINITKNEFRQLGKDISSYLYSNHHELYENLTSSLGIAGTERNLFSALSSYLINSNAPKSIGEPEVKTIAENWVKVLEIIKSEANDITKFIEE